MATGRLLVCATVLGCGSTTTSGGGELVEPETEAAAPQKAAGSVAVSGACGGFEGRSWAADSVGLMNDHLRITPIVGLVPKERSYNIMAAPNPEEDETRLFLEDDGYKLVVFAQEMYREPGDDLAGALRGLEGFESAELKAKRLASGLDVVTATPGSFDTNTEAVLVASAYVASADGTVHVIVMASDEQRARPLVELVETGLRAAPQP